MAWAKSTTTVALALGLLVMTIVGECYGQCSANFRVGYYEGECDKVDVEALVFFVVKKHFMKDKTSIGKLVRLQFHDCFVRGCDASILLEGEGTEKTSTPDVTVGGFDIIEEAKVTLDTYCPGVVSCADIVVLAARAAAFLGGAYWYDIETGRKDGNVSLATEADQWIPSPRLPVPETVKLFAHFGLDTSDFVYLLGCHTIGIAHCSSFQDRLYNFNNAGKPDPSMAPSLLSSLKSKCPRNSNSNSEVYLDQTKGSEYFMDNGFFKSVLEGKGILQIDQQIALDPLTRDIVIEAASNKTAFLAKIGPAMRKMGLIGVITEGVNRLGTCKKKFAK